MQPADHARRLQSLVDQLCVDIARVVFEATARDVDAAFARRLGRPATAPPGDRERAPRVTAGLGTAQPLALDPARLDAALDRIAREHALSTREAQFLTAALHGVPRRYLSTVIGAGEATIKTQMKRLLAKLGVTALDEAVWRVRTEIVGGSVSRQNPRNRRARRADGRRQKEATRS